MSWMEKLCKTYDNCSNYIGKPADIRLLPICHTTQNAQIEIVIDESGMFKDAHVIPKHPKSEAATDIPCTEDSGNRTGSRPTCHPLCDKLQYIAGDFLKFGGEVTSGFAKKPEEPHQIYLELLSKWCTSQYRHPKVEAIYKYVCRGTTIADLCAKGILPKDERTGYLLKEWINTKVAIPLIFGVMPNGNLPEEAFVRWRVEIPGDPQTAIWTDSAVWKSWFDYYSSTLTTLGLCQVTGKFIPLARLHPANLRRAGDKAKIVSANDDKGFTYRGRFTDSTDHQACSIGFEVSQKAHNALRWLIARQGYRHDTQAVVAWCVADKPVPDPFADSRHFLLDEEDLSKKSLKESLVIPSSPANVAQDFALRLKRKIMGYKEVLGDENDIVVLSLDSATTGRMSITYYRELTSSEFLTRIETWHEQCCWFQNYSKGVHFIGAPSPYDIAEVAYGQGSVKKLLRSTIRQILPCIIDAAPIPRHLVENCVRRACKRSSGEKRDLEWEKALGVACALYRKHVQNERIYQMALETDLTSRDYLYGRLLAIAERLEEVALGITKENRPTNAARLMQRFADHPYATWLAIEKALNPYKIRLSTKRGPFLSKMNGLMDEVMTAFKTEEFKSCAKLSGEFLLGYHCQREALKNKIDKINVEESTEESEE